MEIVSHSGNAYNDDYLRSYGSIVISFRLHEVWGHKYSHEMILLYFSGLKEHLKPNSSSNSVRISRVPEMWCQ